jgi:hypothetical protein
MEVLDYPSWRWGLSLIALTMAFHAVAIVLMGIVASRTAFRPRYWCAIAARALRTLHWAGMNGTTATE